MPQLALCELDAPPATIVAMQHTLAQAGLAMSAGQQRDVAMAGSRNVSVEAVDASVAGKSGEASAMLAALGAHLAGAPEPLVECYRAMGRALGAAGQVRSDCYDLFATPRSKDLAQGARTLPIALYLERLPGEEQDAFLALLDQARTEPSAQEDARARMRAAGVLRECAMLIDLYRGQAHAALAQAEPREPAGGALRRLIDRCSLIAGGSE